MLVSLPMLALYSELQTVKDIGYDEIAVLLKDPLNPDSSDRFVAALRERITPE